jgi:hypothetical protein
MTGNLVTFAAFLMQPQPQLFAMLKQVAALHRDRRADPREAIDHHSDQRPVAEPN